jgi:hypothetical protein
LDWDCFFALTHWTIAEYSTEDYTIWEQEPVLMVDYNFHDLSDEEYSPSLTGRLIWYPHADDPSFAMVYLHVVYNSVSRRRSLMA